jgi:hypothetical protein
MPIIKNLSGLHLKVVMDGNSLTASNNQYISTRLTTYLTPLVASVEMISLGVSGQRLQTMFNNASGVNGVYSRPNPSKYNILILNEDANGMLQDSYGEYRQLQLMNQYISGAYRAKFDAIITWNGWYSRLPHDLFQPTAQNLLAFKNYCNLANTEGKLYSNVNVDMRQCTNVGGGENQNQNPLVNIDYLHLNNTGNNEVADRLITHGFNTIFTYN